MFNLFKKTFCKNDEEKENLKRYPDDDKTLTEDFFFKYKIIVPNEETKKEMMEAFRHIHYSNIDTEYVMVNQLVHEYLDGENIVVEGKDGR